MRKKKILFSYLYCNKGGVTSVIKQRAKNILENGWEIYAVFRFDNGGREELLDAGLEEVHIYNNTFIDHVQAMIRTHQFDAVVVFDTPELIPAIKNGFSVPLVYEMHTSIGPNLRKNKELDLLKCEKLVVPSLWSKDTILDIFRGIPESSVEIIPNVVDENVFRLEGEAYRLDHPTLLWVGKFSDFKNWKEALEITIKVLKNKKDWQTIWVTGGAIADKDLRKWLNRIFDNTLTDRFNWFHNFNHNDMAKLYRGVAKGGGVLLSSSLYESFCLIAHEAMRCGSPVVSTRVGPLSEVIDHGISGYLYDPGDIKSAVKYILELGNDLHTREKIIQAMPESLAPFNQVKLEGNYVSLLEEVVN